jgi:hypothetical protein
MDNLFQLIDRGLTMGITLKEIKPDLVLGFDSGVFNYCVQMSNYSSDKYNRIKLHDFSNQSFEMILICWDTDSSSKIHDHPTNGCILHLMTGVLEEHLYDHDIKLKQVTTVNAGDTCYMDNNLGYHKIKCIKKAMSLHIYSPVNHKLKIMEE